MENIINYWHRLSPLSKSLIKIISINLLIGLSFYALEVSAADSNWHFTASSLHYTYRFLKGMYDRYDERDSWQYMSKAFNYLQSPHQLPLYTKIFFQEQSKFQYPVTSLLFIQFANFLKGTLPVKVSLFQILNEVSFLLAVVMLFFSIKIFNSSLLYNSGEKNDRSRSEAIIQNIALFFLALLFYPFVKSYTLGQIQTWINSFFTIALWCWLKDRKGISGVLIDIICLIKPQFLILYLWGDNT